MAEAHPEAESAGTACTTTNTPITERKRVRKRDPQQHLHGCLTIQEAHGWGLVSCGRARSRVRAHAGQGDVVVAIDRCQTYVHLIIGIGLQTEQAALAARAKRHDRLERLVKW